MWLMTMARTLMTTASTNSSARLFIYICVCLELAVACVGGLGAAGCNGWLVERGGLSVEFQ